MPKIYLIFRLILIQIVTISYINANDIDVLKAFDIDESYIYDEQFISYKKAHQKNLNSFYRHSINRGKDIIPTIKGILKEENIHQLFLYLCMVESGFKIDAKSNKKAVGLWQFIPSTAQNYNLTINQFYDERLDIVNSTISATKYLKKLYKEFGKWYLAILAYNCGEGRLHQAINRAKTDELIILIDNDNKLLPKESREYIKKILIISMLNTTNKIHKPKIPIIKEKEEIDTIEVEITPDANLTQIANIIDINLSILISLNKKYTNKIKIPIDKVYVFYLKYELKTKTKRDYIITHKVKLGESLKSISNRYKTTISNIKRDNSIDSDYLILDSILIISVDRDTFERVK